jgi:hypothetical protein
MGEAEYMKMRLDQGEMQIFPLNVDGAKAPEFLETIQFQPIDRTSDVVRLVEDIIARYGQRAA